MVLRVLVETGFMLALNPKDKHHEWAMSILRDAKIKKISLYISPVAPLELSLIMRSKGYSDRDINRVLNAVETVIRSYTRLQYPQIGLRELAYSAELRARYTDLTFFDSIHAAIAILNDLVYYDLDPIVKDIVLGELGKQGR